MKIKNLRSAMLLLLSFAFFSCHKEEEVAPIEEIVPLQVGNEWHYQVSYYNTEGIVISTSTYRKAVVKDTLINNSEWYILSDGRIVRNSRDGYVYFQKANKEAYITYPSTSQGGIGYGYEYPAYTLWILIKRTLELSPVQNAAINLPSYVFSTERQTSQKASSLLSSTWTKDYVSPEVGLVRSDAYYADSDKLFRRYELVSYSVQ